MSQPERPAARERLDALAGKWMIEGSHPVDASMRIPGESEFEWLEGGRFLLQRSTVDRPEFPDGISIIGCDGSEDKYAMLYSDSRGVFRIMEMSLSDEVWTLLRYSADPFSQRFIGEFADEGKTINGRWERSDDGSNLELDFALTYTKEG